LKVVHICLSCFYIDGASYQENELVRQHVADGHEVLVIASTENFSRDGLLTYVEPSSYIGEDGAPVVRLPYRSFLPHKVMRKLRLHPGVYERLAEFRPDAILFHGACGYEIITVARYAAAHPSVPFYVDSHEDWNNSARNFVSRELLHKLFYRYCLKRALPAVRKVLCISTETIDFVETVYRVPRERVEFYPLGGKLVPSEAYAERRSRARSQLGIVDGEIIFLQSGKMTPRKKLIESLRAFASSAPAEARFLITGVLQNEIKDEAEALIARDPRVSFLGWKSADDLTDLLCAADVYLQPGTQSVTMQHSLCCHCAVILDDVPAHKVYFRNNGWPVTSQDTLERAIAEVATADLETMQENSFKIATEMLDYAKLAQRVLHH